MIYTFADFELDSAKVELRADGQAVGVEPQVFSLLLFLVENRDRVVTKDELVERIWDGRFISDAAIASRIKSARQALGDDGRAQRFIRTAHGVGFRFVADVGQRAPARAFEDATVELEPPTSPPRPSIAVLPFRLVGVAGQHAAIAEALPHDLITGLSRLHWLFVIARESSFRFRSAETNIDLVRTALGVRYCLSGVVEVFGASLTVSVELCDSFDRGIIWSERYKADLNEVHDVRDDIVRAVINALELQIPLNEARRAQLKCPEDLDAWSAYHLGLQHMFRFNKADNARATTLFARAIDLDPNFARGYAGLSFTHFQDAFLGYAKDVGSSAKLAQHFAQLSLERDPVDPFGNFAMGRAFWLHGDLDSSLPWIDRANTLNPNYAQAKYSRAWVEALLGEGEKCQANCDMALALSPLDPMRYAMLAARGFSHMVRGQSREAAEWAERGARAPGAHVLVEMIAVALHAANGDDARAKAWAQSARARVPDINVQRFMLAFPFRDPAMRALMTELLRRHGF